MKKVFLADKIIYLTDSAATIVDEDSIRFNLHAQSDVISAYNAILSDKKHTKVYFIHQNEKELFKYFSSMFTIIDAAGGLVKNEEGECLFIFRNEKWDLPKGKVEKGEEIDIAAVREVEEECGVKQLNIVKELPITYHIYYLKGKPILKRTFWFEMICPKMKLIPQAEEGITDARWLKADEFDMVRGNTYGAILDVIDSCY